MSYSLLDLPLEERPRERLVHLGPESLSTVELVAIILGSGTKQYPVMQLSHALVSRFGTIQHLAEATIAELCEINGIGLTKAIQIKAAFCIGLRAARQAVLPKYRIEHPSHAYHLIKDEIENEKREIFLTIHLDVKNYVINYEIISIGNLSNTLVHPREVFYPAIRHKAAGMILAHNHPSGDATPSDLDIELTNRLIECGRLIGIPIKDHLIIGKQIYTSLRQKGHLFEP